MTMQNTVLTDEQITKVWGHLFGFPPRGVDLMIVRMMEPEGPTAAGVAEYIWDHWMGEPDRPTVEDIINAISTGKYDDVIKANNQNAKPIADSLEGLDEENES